MATTKTEDKGTEFILKLNGIDLPADARDRIAAELRATLMRELAKTDTGGGGAKKLTAAGGAGGSAFLVPRGWNGGWVIGPVGFKDAIARFDKVRFETKEVAL